MTDFANTPVDKVSSTGNAIQVVVATSDTEANGGTAIPCRECFVTRIDGDPAISIRMNIANAATMSAGLPIPVTSLGMMSPLRVPIDDVNKLRFIASAVATVIVMYRL